MGYIIPALFNIQFNIYQMFQFGIHHPYFLLQRICFFPQRNDILEYSFIIRFQIIIGPSEHINVLFEQDNILINFFSGAINSQVDIFWGTVSSNIDFSCLFHFSNWNFFKEILSMIIFRKKRFILYTIFGDNKRVIVFIIIVQQFFSSCSSFSNTCKYLMLLGTDGQKSLSTWKDVFLWISSGFDNEVTKANESTL